NLWAENPQAMENVNPLIGDFFRQLDAVGGMPQAIEDYDYLRRFLAELETGMPRYSRPGDVTIRETVGQLSGDAHRWEYLGDIRLGLEGSRIIPWDDLPDHVYHVTVAGRAVE